jgi:hypothetical protein
VSRVSEYRYYFTSGESYSPLLLKQSFDYTIAQQCGSTAAAKLFALIAVGQ